GALRAPAFGDGGAARPGCAPSGRSVALAEAGPGIDLPDRRDVRLGGDGRSRTPGAHGNGRLGAHDHTCAIRRSWPKIVKLPYDRCRYAAERRLVVRG